MRHVRAIARRRWPVIMAVAVVVLGGLAALAYFYTQPPHSAFDGAVECKRDDGFRVCGGEGTTVKSFDGTPIGVNLGLPRWGKGPWPLLVSQGGYPGGKFPAAALKGWAKSGYAILSISNRGLGDSGGESRFMDTRYEVRDLQTMIGKLVDDGIAEPDHIGVFGGSYGGAEALAIGALRDRVMLPDGKLEAWMSPDGEPVSVQVAVGQNTWTDLPEALAPNGRATGGNPPAGPLKASWARTLLQSGDGTVSAAPPARAAELRSWIAALIRRGGKPSADDVAREMLAFHSVAGIAGGGEPAPTFMVAGLTDDLFPADQSIGYMQEIQRRYPSVPVGVLVTDTGHPRAQNKTADLTAALTAEREWIDHYLKGDGPTPESGIEFDIRTCGPDASETGRKAGAPAGIAAGEVTLSGGTEKTVPAALPGAALASAARFEPLAGGGACAEVPAAAVTAGATFDLAAGEEGFTLAGTPTVEARLTARAGSQVAARLLDVSPDGSAVLVSRALWLPAAGGESQSFTLAPTGWRFAPGHVARLELLPADPGYGRAFPGQLPVGVSDLSLRLPVLDAPGADGGLVRPVSP